MANFDEFVNGLKDGIAELAKREAREFLSQAEEDAKAFVEAMKDDLETWMKELADGKLTSDDFKFLVKGCKDVAEMQALKQVGLAKVHIERIVNGVIDLVINAAMAAV